MRILIVGNIIKDVYLGLDERKNSFELDENNIPWMNVAFNGSHYPFFNRTSVFGGAAVTLEVFKKMGIEAEVSGSSFSLSNEGPDNGPTLADSYRYMVSAGENLSYLIPTEKTDTKFVSPNTPVDWVYVDCSANISSELVEKIKNYLGLTPGTKLAVFVNCETINEDVSELARNAKIVFSNGSIEEMKVSGATCVISNHEIRCGNLVRRFSGSKNDLMTELTVNSIISATIFGALTNGSTTKDALDLSVLNIENSKLSETLSFKKLKDMLDAKHRAEGNLRLIAKTLVSPGRGILAADESGGSIHKKFEQAGIPDDEEHRRDYRNIFFTTHELEKYVNGVILFDETARQKADDGSDFVSYLTNKGIVPGIKVDLGLEPFSEAGYENEKWTKGLDDLPERLAEYYEMGARFAKWRAAFEVELENIGESSEVKVKTPSDFAIKRNCEILAEYARDCQDAGIVPIVEPEVVHDGYYSIETCAKLAGKILDCLFKELDRFGVNIEGCLLKTNMVLAGKKFDIQSTPAEVGEWTAKVLKEHCPKELSGIVFLSGGQGVEQATDNLQAVTNNGPFPWPVTFSYARALQGPALDAWKGDNNNADAAREAFHNRLVANCKALTKNDLS